LSFMWILHPPVNHCVGTIGQERNQALDKASHTRPKDALPIPTRECGMNGPSKSLHTFDLAWQS
jgi:hypothetical protein